MSRISFVSTTAAAEWQDGVVAGTGSLGAVLFGDAAAHSIVFSHEEFFLPLEARVTRPAALGPQLPEIRRLVEAGETAAAAKLVEATARATGVWGDILPLDPFVPIAGLSIETSVPALPGSYVRTGRFDTGVIEVRWDTAEGTMSITLTPVRERAAVQVRIASSFVQTVAVAIRLSSDRSLQVGNVSVIDFRDRVGARLGANESSLRAAVWPLQRPEDGSRPVAARLEARVVSGQVSLAGEHEVRAALEPGGEIVFEVTATIERNTPLPELPPALRSLPEGHAELFAACRLDLASGVDDEVPIERLLQRARAGDADYERAVIEFAFAAGRSAVIASTGVLPPNLVGVWQGSWAPAWSGDYTVNGNVQLGAMAAMYSTGTPELLRSLFRLHLRFLDQFEENARRLFGVAGYAMPTHLSGHAYANHHSTEYPHEFWYGSAAWALRAGFDYFSTTGDIAFVAEVGWPFAVKTMEFLTQVTTTRDGVRHFVPSYSPENTPAGASNPLSVDATMDLALAHDAVRVATAFARVVGETPPTDWAEFAASLPPYRVDAASGALAEWAKPGTPEQVAHRHASQLYPYWYDDGDAATSTEIDEAALRTVAKKLAWRAEKPYGPPGHQEMAFGLSSIGIAAARLGDAASAYQCALWLARDHFEPNAISRHDQGSIFNLDGCGALPAVVAEMLLSSAPGRLALLPALPPQWPSGAVHGLTGRGGIIIDELQWSPGEVVVTLRRRQGSEPAWEGRTIKLFLPGPRGTAPRAAVDVEVGTVAQTFRWAR